MIKSNCSRRLCERRQTEEVVLVYNSTILATKDTINYLDNLHDIKDSRGKK